MSPTEKINRYNEISRKYGDPWIWGIYITLLIISVVESYSASSREIAAQGIYMPIVKQCVFLGIGALCVVFLQRVDYNKPKFLYAMIPGLAVITVVSLIYVMFFGEVINGAQRAMTIIPGLVTLQPAELAKLSIVTMLSYIFAKSQKNRDISNRGMFGAAFVVALYGGLMIRSGLTNTLLLVAISFSMLLIGGAQFKKIGYLMGFFVVMMGLFFIIKQNNDKKQEVFNETQKEMQMNSMPSSSVVLNDAPSDGQKANHLRSGTWKNRLREWWHSDSLVYRDITDKNQQEMFSRMAQAHGGIFGRGVGQSRECSRLPLAFSDYIFSIIVEELGMVGGIFVLLLYLSLLGRAAMIVRHSKRVLPSLLVIGMASFITFQALFHMAINVGVFPVSGQPLPLISKGGTSILVISIAFGVMLSVSRTIANGGNKKDKADETPVIEGLDAVNPTEIPPRNVWK